MKGRYDPIAKMLLIVMSGDGDRIRMPLILAKYQMKKGNRIWENPMERLKRYSRPKDREGILQT